MRRQPSCYVVAYELSAGLGVATRLTSELKRSRKWWRYLKNTWLVVRDPTETVEEFAHTLTTIVGARNRLMILPAVNPILGTLPEGAWEWIERNVREPGL